MESNSGHAGWVCLAVLGAGLSLVGATQGHAEPATDDGSIPAPATNVRIHDASQAARAVTRAVQGASRRLADPKCQQLLTDFSDVSGRPLQASTTS
jgi:hypothetical protein